MLVLPPGESGQASTSPESCLCSRSYYAASTTADGLPLCALCPSTATACEDVVGTTLATLPVLPLSLIHI